jgi:hypothetical protein
MSIKVMEYVWENSKQRASLRLVLLAIADNANQDGDAYPGIPHLAKKCNMSERNIQLSIRALERARELQVFVGLGRKTISGATNLYRVVMPEANQQLPTNSKGKPIHPRGVKPVSPRRKREVKHVSPDEVKPVTPDEVKPVSPKPYSEPSPEAEERATALVNAWIQSAGKYLPLGYNAAKCIEMATDLLMWEPPITPEDVRTVTTSMVSRPRKSDYAFQFLVQDLTGYQQRRVAQKQAPKTATELDGMSLWRAAQMKKEAS